MDQKVEIVLFDELPIELRKNLNTIDPYHSNYFWHKCAEEWQNEFVHKVYSLVDDQRSNLYGFFSLRVNNMKENQNQIPILDIAFIDVSNELSEDSVKSIFTLFLEFIEKIAINVSKKVGCRYIRSYIPTLPDINNQNSPGQPMIKFLEGLYINMKYFDPPFKEKEKIRKIKDKNLKNSNPVMILKYLLRDLRFQNN